MVLECQADETLFISEAYYGSNSVSCGEDTCCAPDDVNDCRLSVSDVNADEWLTIRSFCNYETTCVYQYQGQELTDCGQVLADYLQLTYVCATGT